MQKYQEILEESMKGSKFVFDSVNLLHYYLQKVSLNRSGLYVDSPKWLKSILFVPYNAGKVRLSYKPK